MKLSLRGAFLPDIAQEIHPIRKAVKSRETVGELERSPVVVDGHDRDLLEEDGLGVVEVGVADLRGLGGAGGVQEDVEGVTAIAGEVGLPGAPPEVQKDPGIVAGGSEVPGREGEGLRGAPTLGR